MSKKEKSVKISFKMSPGRLKVFDAIGEKKGFDKSRSAHIRLALNRYILSETLTDDKRVIYSKVNKKDV